jgi:hypothetical protein
VRLASLDEMRQISGVGPRKLEQFGAQFLEITISGDAPGHHEVVPPRPAADRT